MLHLQNNTLHLIDTLWLGGAQQVVKGLFENNETQNKLFLMALRQTNPMYNINNPQVYVVNNVGKWSMQKVLKKIREVIKIQNIKTLHCHLPKSHIMGCIIKNFYNKDIKLVIHEQGDIIELVPFSWPVYVSKPSLIDNVICCSQMIAKAVIKNAPKLQQKVNVIYNYTIYNPKNISTDENKKKHPFRTKIFKIGFAGRIIKRKGWQELLEAYSLLEGDMTDTKLELHIAGTGPEYNMMTEKIRKKYKHLNINVWGYLEDMSTFYQHIDVLCVASHWEPLGMVHLEAMNFGIPVIASDVEGMNELLIHKNNALLFKAKNVTALKNVMKELLNNEGLYKQLCSNVKHTAAAYNYNYFEKELQQVYTSLNI